MTPDQLSSAIKTARKRLNLTQPQAAERWGVSLDTIRSWEQGRRLPNAAALLKLLPDIQDQSGKRPR